MLELLLDKD